MKIYKNGILVSASSSTESGSFVVTVGDVIKTDVAAGLGKLKKLRVANDVDGVMVDTSSTALVQLSYTFTEEDKNYNIDGSVSNP
jgi:hypothetical protein